MLKIYIFDVRPVFMNSAVHCFFSLFPSESWKQLIEIDMESTVEKPYSWSFDNLPNKTNLIHFVQFTPLTCKVKRNVGNYLSPLWRKQLISSYCVYKASFIETHANVLPKKWKPKPITNKINFTKVTVDVTLRLKKYFAWDEFIY